MAHTPRAMELCLHPARLASCSPCLPERGRDPVREGAPRREGVRWTHGAFQGRAARGGLARERPEVAPGLKRRAGRAASGGFFFSSGLRTEAASGGFFFSSGPAQGQRSKRAPVAASGGGSVASGDGKPDSRTAGGAAGGGGSSGTEGGQPGSRRLPCMLSIAGSDSGGGAGIQADIKAAAAQGVWCSTAVTGLTAQNTLGVQAAHPTPPEIVLEQLRSVLTDIRADAIKTGMLPNGAVVAAVCHGLQDLAPRVPLVVDPVLVATSGDSLADSDALEMLRERLLPLACLVTPNLREAEALLGVTVGSIRDLAGMCEAALHISRLGPRAVYLKGGHLPESEDAVDVFFDGTALQELRAARVLTANTHGTGCSLSAAVAARLALGEPLPAAVQAAKAYLSWTLEGSVGLRLGSGRGAQGPLGHLPSLLDPKPAHEGRRGGALWDPQRYLRLYAVTDSRMNARWGRSLSDAVRLAAQGGATIIQIREKSMDTGDLIKEVRSALKVAREAGIPLVVNDRVDVALACDADGVHVGQSDMPAATARSLLGPDKIVGVSAKCIPHVLKAAEDGADYVGVGGVFPTSTKENNTTIGVSGLLEICRGSPLPVVAIGGINEANVETVFTQERPPSLAGVAVVSAIFDRADVVGATQLLWNSLSCAEGSASYQQAV